MIFLLKVVKIGKRFEEKVMKLVDDDDHNMVLDTVESQLHCVCREEVVQALNEIKIRKSPGFSDVSDKLIVANGAVEICVMID